MSQLIASTLGLELPVFKARDAVMRSGRRSTAAMVRFQNKFVCIDFGSKVSYQSSAGLLKDDDTASTCSSDESCTSCSGTVCFAEELVSAVYERPKTTYSEKHLLFYSDLEYRQFKRDYCLYKLELQRNSLVKFQEEPVTEVHVYHQQGEKDELFYSEKELQR